MATRCLARALLSTKHSLPSAFSHSCAAATVLPCSSSFLYRLRPLVAAAYASYFRRLVPAISTRAFSTRQTATSLNDPNPNWSNRPPKETILLDGCDFEHWLVVMEKPEGDPTRDEIIDSYIKTLAMVVGSEEEARMKIYSVSTRHYFAFGALVSEELSYKLKELPKVRWVLPDSYLDVKNKDYGGEPFINGQAVPYDPKYHEEWVRNNARANERNKRPDRPRNFDRSRNFERRREMQGQNSGGPGGNFGGAGGGPGGNYSGQAPPVNAPNPGPNMGYGGGGPGGGNYAGQGPPVNPPNPGPNMGYGGGGPGGNYAGQAPPVNAPNPGPNMGYGGGGPGGNYSGQAPPVNAPNPGPNMGGQDNYGVGVPPNYPTNDARAPMNNAHIPGPNSGGARAPYQSGPGLNQSGFPSPGHIQGQNQNYGGGEKRGFGPNSGYGQNNMGLGQGQYQQSAAYPPNVGGGNPQPQSQNIPGRDLPPSSSY